MARSSNQYNLILFLDQTPTPTRFLHLGNQMGLFDELNPFDREFKTAQKEVEVHHFVFGFILYRLHLFYWQQLSNSNSVFVIVWYGCGFGLACL